MAELKIFLAFKTLVFENRECKILADLKILAF